MGTLQCWPMMIAKLGIFTYQGARQTMKGQQRQRSRQEGSLASFSKATRQAAQKPCLLAVSIMPWR